MVKGCRVDNKQCKLQIWDTAGVERFRDLTNSYFRGVHGMIICYDITNASSYNRVPDYME